MGGFGNHPHQGLTEVNFQDDQKIQIQQATDLVRLVGEQVALRPRGKEFIGLCPFHDDKNPSLYVSPAKQIYKCFSCGAGGDAFSFVMAYHKMTFPEALAHLAERAGIKLETRRLHDGAVGEESGPTDRQLTLHANAQAAAFYQALLKHAEHGKPARDYLAQRGINARMIEEFQIGYAPDRWDGLVLMAQEKQWNRRGLELAGLVSARSNAPGYYDRFRHRLMFPIGDALGRPIALGGRKLREEDEPKYLNSPESAAFNKSATLYGLHLAKKAIIDSRVAVVVEGYTDVIACHQAGVRNVVATLGTALTPQHVAELRRYCEKVVLIYDADEAGIKASDRAVEVFLTESMDVAIAVLPDELDPADLLGQPGGLGRWQHAMAEATDALKYQFRRFRSQLEAADTVTGKQKAAEEFLRRIVGQGLQRSGPIRQAMVVQQLAQLLHMSEQAIHAMIKSLTPAARPAPRVESAGHAPAIASAIPPHRIKAIRLAEQHMVGCLLHKPALFHLVLADGRSLDEAVTPAELTQPELAAVYEKIYTRLSGGESPTLQGLILELAECGRLDLTAAATDAHGSVELQADGSEERLEQMLTGAVAAIVGQRQDRHYEQARSAMQQPGAASEESTVALLRQVAEHHRDHPSPSRIAKLTG